jgi:hypothetical protein
MIRLHLSKLAHVEWFIQTFNYRSDQNKLVEMFFGLIVISGYLPLFLPSFRADDGAVYAENRQIRKSHG